jgi:hypothetical protein
MPGLFLLLAVLVGCADEDPVLVSLPADPGVLFRGEDGPVLAQIGDWKITTRDLETVHPIREGASAKESLQHLVDGVLVVKAGVEQGHEGRFPVLLEWRRALAREWALQNFGEGFSAESVPDSLWQEIYSSVRARFDHKETFFVLDVQYLCCMGHPDGCDAKDVARCQDQNLPMMSNIQEFLAQSGVKTKEQLDRKLEEYRATYGGEFGVADYAFQYDFSKGPDQQGRYDRVNENVARGAKATKVGEFSPVVASRNGLHILLLTQYLPETHRKFGDPGVKEELIQSFLPILREKEVADAFAILVKRQQIKLHPENLGQVDWTKATGLK